MKGSKKWWLAVFLYMGAIFVVSSIPGDDIPSVSFYGSDKIAHLLEYAGLGLLLGKTFTFSFFKSPRFLAVLVGILYGVSDEIHQSFVPNRQCDVFDLLFDGAGCALVQLMIKKG